VVSHGQQLKRLQRATGGILMSTSPIELGQRSLCGGGAKRRELIFLRNDSWFKPLKLLNRHGLERRSALCFLNASQNCFKSSLIIPHSSFLIFQEPKGAWRCLQDYPI
jgi:hypothetical protein